MKKYSCNQNFRCLTLILAKEFVCFWDPRILEQKLINSIFFFSSVIKTLKLNITGRCGNFDLREKNLWEYTVTQ